MEQIDTALPYLVGISKLGLITVAGYLWKIYHTVATKDDVAEVEQDIEERCKVLHDRIDRFKEEARSADNERDARMHQEFTTLRQEITTFRNEISTQLSEIRSTLMK